MILHPTSIQELAEGLHNAAATSTRITDYELSSLPRSIVHHAEDLTVTLTSNITLSELQAALAPHRQWLPVDPPAEIPLTIEQILSNNLSGPRRYGYGTIREHILGIKVMLADGRVVQSGGQVVKNVAGFDLCKLFIGSRGSIGIILEATFKLRPLPEAEEVFACEYHTLAETDAVITTLLDSPISPILFDLHNLNHNQCWELVVGFAGTREDVAWQASVLRSLGNFRGCTSDYLDAAVQHIPNINATQSVLPSRLSAILASLPAGPVLAHAGNGIIRNGTANPVAVTSSISSLLQRLKNEFDPAGIFNSLQAEKIGLI